MLHHRPPSLPASGYFLSAGRPGEEPRCEDHEPGCSDVARRGLCISEPGGWKGGR
jgi:hypothetical protein